MARARNTRNKCRACGDPCPLFVYGEKSPTSKRSRLYCDSCSSDQYKMKQLAEPIPNATEPMDREYRRPNHNGRRVIRKGSGMT